jgi:arginase
LTLRISKVGVIGIPYNVGWKGPGIEEGAQALRNAGLVDELKKVVSEVVDCGDVEVRLPPRDESNPKLLNAGRVEAVCRSLAAKVHGTVDRGYFPLIIGGEDSVLMGIIEGFQRALGPRIGLVYLDAHGDFNTPETTPSGLIGGMNVAITAGRGPKELVEMFGRSPLLPEENIVLYGTRELDAMEERALAESEVMVYMREKIRGFGVGKAVDEIVRDLEPRCDKVYVHVDLDVLDETAMSAQSYPVRDGLSMGEFQETLQGLVRSGRLCGMAIMVFNAAKDPEGVEAKKVVRLIADVLRPFS